MEKSSTKNKTDNSFEYSPQTERTLTSYFKDNKGHDAFHDKLRLAKCDLSSFFTINLEMLNMPPMDGIFDKTNKVINPNENHHLSNVIDDRWFSIAKNIISPYAPTHRGLIKDILLRHFNVSIDHCETCKALLNFVDDKVTYNHYIQPNTNSKINHDHKEDVDEEELTCNINIGKDKKREKVLKQPANDLLHNSLMLNDNHDIGYKNATLFGLNKNQDEIKKLQSKSLEISKSNMDSVINAKIISDNEEQIRINGRLSLMKLNDRNMARKILRRKSCYCSQCGFMSKLERLVQDLSSCIKMNIRKSNPSRNAFLNASAKIHIRLKDHIHRNEKNQYSKFVNQGTHAYKQVNFIQGVFVHKKTQKGGIDPDKKHKMSGSFCSSSVNNSPKNNKAHINQNPEVHKVHGIQIQKSPQSTYNLLGNVNEQKDQVGTIITNNNNNNNNSNKILRKSQTNIHITNDHGLEIPIYNPNDLDLINKDHYDLIIEQNDENNNNTPQLKSIESVNNQNEIKSQYPNSRNSINEISCLGQDGQTNDSHSPKMNSRRDTNIGSSVMNLSHSYVGDTNDRQTKRINSSLRKDLNTKDIKKGNKDNKESLFSLASIYNNKDRENGKIIENDELIENLKLLSQEKFEERTQRKESFRISPDISRVNQAQFSYNESTMNRDLKNPAKKKTLPYQSNYNINMPISPKETHLASDSTLRESYNLFSRNRNSTPILSRKLLISTHEINNNQIKPDSIINQCQTARNPSRIPSLKLDWVESSDLLRSTSYKSNVLSCNATNIISEKSENSKKNRKNKHRKAESQQYQKEKLSLDPEQIIESYISSPSQKTFSKPNPHSSKNAHEPIETFYTRKSSLGQVSQTNPIMNELIKIKKVTKIKKRDNIITKLKLDFETRKKISLLPVIKQPSMIDSNPMIKNNPIEHLKLESKSMFDNKIMPYQKYFLNQILSDRSTLRKKTTLKGSLDMKKSTPRASKADAKIFNLSKEPLNKGSTKYELLAAKKKN